MIQRSLILLSTIAMFSSASAAQADDKKKDEKLALQLEGLRAAKFTLSECVATALKRVPGQAMIVKFDVEKKKDKLKVEYEVQVLLEGVVYEVDVDALSGTVADVDPDYKTKARPANAAQEMHFHFDGDVPGSPTADWVPAENNSSNTPGAWKIMAMDQAPSGKNVIALAETANKGSTYNLIIAQYPVGPNLSIQSKVKALSGEIDQGGGLMWRVQDPNNYYIARWNPLEKNIRVYKVIEGKRSAPFKSVDIETDGSAWHTLHVDHVGSSITISFDGAKVIECEDDEIKTAGKFGLWTKADARTAFDAIVLSPLGG